AGPNAGSGAPPGGTAAPPRPAPAAKASASPSPSWNAPSKNSTTRWTGACAAVPSGARRTTDCSRCPASGRRGARVLLAELPELGPRPSRQLAALVGLAPDNRARGRRRGRRRICGGRAAVRAAPYQAALVAARFHAPRMRSDQALLARGKAKQVALVALARRLLTILNARLRHRLPWDEKRVVPTRLPQQSLPPLRGVRGSDGTCLDRRGPSVYTDV